MALLTISIPIYNRASYLEKMLNRFMQDKLLFEETINLFISDNCSEDDLSSICKKYQNLGLRLEYNRNSENLGMDGNFEICINKGKESDYLWILGSDDILTVGALDVILPILKQGVNSLHISNEKGVCQEVHYNNSIEYLKEINVMITFLSANIISSREIGNINLKKYKGSYLTQVPVYITTILTRRENVYLRYNYLEDYNDSAKNGGYNFFHVFMDNYYMIWQEFVSKKVISKTNLNQIKKYTFIYFHCDYVFRTLIGKPSQSLDMTGCIPITFKHYWAKPYLYTSIGRKFFSWIKAAILRRTIIVNK